MTRSEGRRLAGFLACFVAAWPFPAAFAQTFTPVRIKAGGTAPYTDSAGNVWSADTGYNTGFMGTNGTSISGTPDPTLYQWLRWDGGSAPELEYALVVPPGVYEVRLHFAETWSGAFAVGARIFGVDIEGSLALPSIDLYAEAGANAAVVKTVSTAVTDGELNIRFIHIVQDTFINAIEVLWLTKPSPPVNIVILPFSTTQLNLSWDPSFDDVGVTGYEVERCEGVTCTNFAVIAAPGSSNYQDSEVTAATTYRYRLRAVDTSGMYSDYSAIKTVTTQGTTPVQPVRINAGGGMYTDSMSNVWSADTGFNTGLTGTSGVSIAGTSDQTLYQSVRWDIAPQPELEYSVTVPPGQYQARLHFAETWSGAFSVGARVFDVQLEGVSALSDVDVYAEAGANVALIKTATTSVGDGALNIRFLHGVDNPFVNGIEVLWFVPADPTAPGAPSGLSATPISAEAIALSWSPATDNVAVTGYAVERCAGSACTNFTEVGTTTSTSRNDSGLVSGTTYRYRVRAFDAAGNRSVYSTVAEATTPNASAEYIYDELGRLAQVTIANGASIVYAYDEAGNVSAIIRSEP